MNDVLSVRLDESLGDLDGKLQRPCRLEGCVVEELGQRPSSYQLHRDEGGAVGLVDLVHHGDRGVNEPRGGVGLFSKTSFGVGVRARH